MIRSHGARSAPSAVASAVLGLSLLAAPGVARASSPAETRAAFAVAAPPLLPTVDATIRYRVSPSGRPPEDVTVSFGAGGRLLRIDGPAGGGATILDRDARTITAVVPGPRVFLVVPIKGPIDDPFMLSSDMRFTATGQSEVLAGVACEDWRLTSPKGDGTACVTPTGLLLSASGGDGSGETGHLLALTVSLAPVPADRFAPPAGYRRIAHPAAGGGGAP